MFACLSIIIFTVNIAKIQYFRVALDVQAKYSWKLMISLLKYCTLHKTHFVPTSLFLFWKELWHSKVKKSKHFVEQEFS